MYNKTIIRFGFCVIQNNQGLGKGYQSQPSAWLFWISQKRNLIIVYNNICMGNRMNVSAIKDSHYEWYLQILSSLHEPFERIFKYHM